MSLFSGLFHALTHPLTTITDPIGTIINCTIEANAPKVKPPTPEDIDD